MRFFALLALVVTFPFFVCEAQTAFIGKYLVANQSGSSATVDTLQTDNGPLLTLEGLPQVFPAQARLIVKGSLSGTNLKVSSATFEKSIPKALGLKKAQVLIGEVEGEPSPITSIAPLEQILAGPSDSVRTYFENISGNQVSYQFSRATILKLPTRSKIKEIGGWVAVTSALEAQKIDTNSFDMTLVYTPSGLVEGMPLSANVRQKLMVIGTNMVDPGSVKLQTKRSILRFHGLSDASLIQCGDLGGNVTPLKGTCSVYGAADSYSAIQGASNSRGPSASEQIMLGWAPESSAITPMSSGVYTLAARNRGQFSQIALKLPYGPAPAPVSARAGQEYEVWIEFFDAQAEGGDTSQRSVLARLVPKHRTSESRYDNTALIVFKGQTSTRHTQGLGQTLTIPGTNISITPLGLADGATPQSPKNYRFFVSLPNSAVGRIPVLLPQFAYQQETAITAVVGKRLKRVTPAHTGGTALKCTAMPALPAGVKLNQTNCSITGRPSKASKEKMYTISGTNTSGTFSTTVKLTVTKAQKTKKR